MSVWIGDKEYQFLADAIDAAGPDDKIIVELDKLSGGEQRFISVASNSFFFDQLFKIKN